MLKVNVDEVADRNTIMLQTISIIIQPLDWGKCVLSGTEVYVLQF